MNDSFKNQNPQLFLVLVESLNLSMALNNFTSSVQAHCIVLECKGETKCTAIQITYISQVF